MTSADSGRWGDLQTRVISALVMIVVGTVDVWLGGWPFILLVVALCGVMVWELVQMVSGPSSTRKAMLLGLFAATCVLISVNVTAGFALASLAAAQLAISVLVPRANRVLCVVYATMIVIAGFGLITLRNDAGIVAILWLISVVIASDVLGYFAGRSFGGPKFWPAISPKKTWSGTVAGWVGAVFVGVGFVLVAGAGWGLVILSPLVAFAGQMGDIAESWIKRRTGVKDSSHLIPGHGGVLDRFDALIGAVVVVMLLGLILPLPFPTGN